MKIGMYISKNTITQVQMSSVTETIVSLKITCRRTSFTHKVQKQFQNRYYFVHFIIILVRYNFLNVC